MMLWRKEAEQHTDHIYYTGDGKMGYVAVDPSVAPWYFVNLTNKGALMNADTDERKYVRSLDADLNVTDGHLLALAGGKHSARYQAGVSAIGGAFTKPSSAEFSGSWPVTALIAKKADGSFYAASEFQGTGRAKIRATIPTSEQTFIGVVQARSESSGQVEATGSDAGGQLFMFNIDLAD